MSWTVVLLLALAGFLIGGVISFWRQGRRNAAVMAIAAAFLWAWEPV